MIRGDRILLRAVREADLEQLFNLMSDIGNRGPYYPLDILSEVEFKQRFHENGLMTENNGKLLICIEERIIGLIGFSQAGYFDGVEIGYIVFDSANRRQGYMTEALTCLVRHLFLSRKINRIQLMTQPENIPSKRVAEKCGFRYEGTLRGAIFDRGKNVDLEMYALVRAEIEGSCS
jgi:RimJ/RimL family protein N-acetyltransferase